jgi:hypothetical protein
VGALGPAVVELLLALDGASGLVEERVHRAAPVRRRGEVGVRIEVEIERQDASAARRFHRRKPLEALERDVAGLEGRHAVGATRLGTP